MAQVQSLKGNEPRILKQHPTPDGESWQVRLRIEGHYRTVRVDGLMARVFVGPRPAGLQVCHKDGNGFNNAPSNLYYGAQPQEVHRCAQGHAFTPENTMRRKGRHGDVRKCKRCHRDAMARWRAKKATATD